MPKRATAPPFAPIAFDRQSDVPLYAQLYASLRRAILDGQLSAGARLPSTRTLAGDLGVSRNTVMNAFDQLLAEGYLEAQVGSGTTVTTQLPDDLLEARRAVTRQPGPPPRLSARGEILAAARVAVSGNEGRAPRPFQSGVPALDAFPYAVWGRLAARAWKVPPPERLAYGHPAGFPPLREAIADYLRLARGVRCDAEQVLVVSGSQQALDLAARLLLDPGDTVWMEDPGYLSARAILGSAGAQVVPVPIDGQGLDVAAGSEREPEARMVYVSPSHQYPLGVTMSLARRLALLEWANRVGAWILEDDYDSEYRYSSQPLASLQGLDQGQRVIYLGTFSKVLFPSLRLGYVVVPPALVDAFVAARQLADWHPPSLAQAVVADFMREGHFVRHLRRMRALYEERQALLIDAVRRELGDLLEIGPAEAGMHVAAWLPPGVDDRALASDLRAAGIIASGLSRFALQPMDRGGLVLGYAAFDADTIRDAVRRMAAVIHSTLGA